jgi:hypothetical protein
MLVQPAGSVRWVLSAEVGGRRRIVIAPVAAAAVLLTACGSQSEETEPTTTQATTTAPPPTVVETVPQPPPPVREFAWQAAGALVWHETDVDPSILGASLREHGFGWVAVLLHDGLAEDPLDPVWLQRLREASSLPVGGWGVLRADPEREAELANALLARFGLTFYIANAESDYEFSGPGGPSHERSGRSRRFVAAFRALRPAEFPAGLSSYCRPDMHDIDWQSWWLAGFVFLPQAYVNAHGPDAAPTACVEAAAGFFPPAEVHPTVGTFRARRSVSARAYGRLLAAAGTEGFSVYPAEVTAEAQWRGFGAAIAARGIAR